MKLHEPAVSSSEKQVLGLGWEDALVAKDVVEGDIVRYSYNL